ncbi:hypothetical protein WA158_004830 [Blastocystis sp. Blastoise]
MSAKDEVLVDYENEEAQDNQAAKEIDVSVKPDTYVGVDSTAFKDFMLKDEINKAIAECGFEHPSEIQQQCLAPCLAGSDILCQAKSGMGKTAIFVLSTLNTIVPVEGEISTLVFCNSHEMAFQISKEYERFAKYLPSIRIASVFGGLPVKHDIALLKKKPTIVVGTPGRIEELVREKHLDVSHIKHFILDECDVMLTNMKTRQSVQNVFIKCPRDKQVFLCSATIPADIRPVCLKFLKNPLVIEPADDKLVLHGLSQYVCNLTEKEKIRKLTSILDTNDFNQVVIYVNSNDRARVLNKVLAASYFPSLCIVSKMSQQERFKKFKAYKNNKKPILITTDLFGRGIDIEKINCVINFDFPASSDAYLHRVGRAGRFGTKGYSISFIASEDDKKVLTEIQNRFLTNLDEMPAQIVTK